MQDHLKPQIPAATDDVPPASNAAAVDVDEPDAEDLEVVDTKPTDAKDWKPKSFPPLPANIQKLVQANVRKTKGDSILLTAVVNSGMAEYTLNWIESLKRTKQDDKFLVFAIDEELETTLKEHGYGNHVVQIPEAWFHKDLSAGFSKWLDPNYTPITHSKTLVVERLLYDGITVWFSDVDIVFTSSSIYDYLVTKLNSRRKFTEFLTTQETEQKIINSGFYIMRPTDTNKRILADTIMIQDNEPKVTQQRAMNRVLDELNLSYQTSSVALLDLALFPHGRMFFERNIPHKYGFEPMMVHANYRIGEDKKKSLQAANLWYI
ncbi:nucleotide-diphospho-sugar transferase-domain-containing protein [Dichotomocladium elegans]|nr:nucleotide-diphospho-sugar transferase-domain-containing protein [Dichotomocladium elegans]